MKTVIHPAGSRGGGEHGWLSTRHSFSFADWYEPTRMGFGALRVLNDDLIAPSTGFGMHSHQNMEIISIVIGGAVTHRDSMGNQFEVPAGDVQVMSAGTGVVHSEENASPDTPLSLFQIWIQTSKPNSTPRYAQKSFGLTDGVSKTTLLVAPTEADGALAIQQDAYISYTAIDNDTPCTYTLKGSGRGVYVFVIEGNVSVAGEELGPRDAIGISETETITLKTDTRATVLLIEVPVEQAGDSFE